MAGHTAQSTSPLLCNIMLLYDGQFWTCCNAHSKTLKEITKWRSLCFGMWFCVNWYLFADILEECLVWKDMVTEDYFAILPTPIDSLRALNPSVPLPISALLFPHLAYSSTLKREVAGASKTSVNIYRTTECQLPEDSNFMVTSMKSQTKGVF